VAQRYRNCNLCGSRNLACFRQISRIFFTELANNRLPSHQNQIDRRVSFPLHAPSVGQTTHRCSSSARDTGSVLLHKNCRWSAFLSMSKRDATPIQMTQPEAEWNWARTPCFSATKIERPSSNQRLRALIAAAADVDRAFATLRYHYCRRRCCSRSWHYARTL
jgi:hypothetical protein